MTLAWLADELRGAGLVVVEHAGWKTYDRPGDWSPRYGVVHATAAPRTQPDETQIRVVRDGRVDLPGPIANAAVDRAGRWHVLSAGRCNSTLVGTAGPYRGLGNTYALSVEGCNDNRAEPWPAVQYDAYVRGWAAWCRRLGWSPANLVGHKEHTPGHKTDPTFDMAAFRSRVAVAIAGKDLDMTPEEHRWLQTVHNALCTTAEGYLPPGGKERVSTVQMLRDAAYPLVKGPAGSGAYVAQWMTTVTAQLGAADDQVAELVAAHVLATLTPEKIAAAIPPDLAEQVVDELRARPINIGARPAPDPT